MNAPQQSQTDFRALYDEKDEYIARRDQDSHYAKRVAIEVNHYKIPNLHEVLPANLKIESIAEIGCGTGEIIAGFEKQREVRRVGFDISPKNIEAAKNRFKNVEFTAEPFETYGEEFDVLILSDVIEHVPDDLAFLQSAAKIAKTIVVNLPLEKCWVYRNRQYGPDDPSGHLRNYSVQDGFDLFKAAGLETIKSKQVWPLEEPQEKMRQQLNIEETGHRFTGSLISRAVKGCVMSLSKTVKPIGRRLFASNLFASLRAGE